MEALRAGDPRGVGPYRLERRLGGGGMGRVYLGRSPGGRPVAVKVVRPELAEDEGFRRRFAVEVEAARRVGGFYTAQMVAADPDADPPWLVTAYVPGPSLQEAVDRHGPFPASALGALGSGLAEGVAAVHACGLVHRDLKPSNVILADDGPRVIDFGIARALDTTSQTVSRVLMGTPSFMSPEQARGRAVGPPSDVFSFGAVLAFAGTGRGPFGSGAVEALVYRVVHDEPDLTGLPARFLELVTACLAKEPGDRPTVREVLDRLATSVPEAGRWLPAAVSTMVQERHTAVLTSVDPAADPQAPPEPEAADDPRAAPGRRPRPAPEGLADPDASTVGGSPLATGRAGSASRGTRLMVGNLTARDLEVLVDGGALGAVHAWRSGTFSVTPGPHSLQVRAGSERSAPRQIEGKPGGTVRRAFEVPRGRGRARPERVRSVTFRGRALRKALWVGGVAALLTAVLIVLGFGVFAPSDATSGFTAKEKVLLPAFASLFVGGALFLFGLAGILPDRLDLRFDGFVHHRGALRSKAETVSWNTLDQVSLIGTGRDAALVVWFRRGYGPSPDGAPEHGTLVCRVRHVSRGRDLARLRAALAWFAGDRFVE